MAVGNITAGGTGAIDVNGNNMSLTGTLFAPNGRVIINGNTGVTLTAFLEGLMVELDGNNWALTGSGSQALGQAPTLVE
jgi:formylmethanofuran dehydrogenase subunit C